MSVIDDYLQQYTISGETRGLIDHIREAVHVRVPDATEVISYNMPGFRTASGKLVLGFAINKNSVGIYPHSGTVLDKVRSDLSLYQTAKSALNVSPANPLPDAILDEIITIRLAEIESV